MNTKNKHLALLLLVAVSVQSAGCLTVYKADIQQGNAVSQEMINKLKPGMTRSQVRFVLGTPLITDPFHQDRWDYYYYIRRQGQDTAEERRITVIFQNDLLATVEGDTLKNKEGTVTGDAESPDSSQPKPETEAATTETNRLQKL